ncbi:MAG: ABC transporter ATP-binding protein [Candidatus Baldrarchaeia archaeon]
MLDIISVRGLRTYFFTDRGIVKAVDGVNLDVKRGETLGLIGESGSGKTVTALSILRLVPRPGKIVNGEILFEGKNLLELPDIEMRKIRGRQIAMVFQDPTTSLDPVYTVGYQLQEVIQSHSNLSKEEAYEKAIKSLEMVGIPDVKRRINYYPHQFSQGMRQRISIARALSCEPKVLILDEPTTNLDVTTEAQILELIKNLKSRIEMSMIWITHNLGVVAEMADRVAILYAGQVCEIADTKTIFHNPRHPYTKALLETVPRIDEKRKRLPSIPGSIPDMIHPPSGCRFHPRCLYADDICAKKDPTLQEIEKGHIVACFKYNKL